jgi:hypothetical protein
MLGEGKSYEQVLGSHPEWTYLDIFAAAREAVAANGPVMHREVIRGRGNRHRRTKLPWAEGEEAQLRGMVMAKETVARIAGRLGRERGAIRQKILELKIMGHLEEKERRRFNRMSREDSGNVRGVK